MYLYKENNSNRVTNEISLICFPTVSLGFKVAAFKDFVMVVIIPDLQDSLNFDFKFQKIIKVEKKLTQVLLNT